MYFVTSRLSFFFLKKKKKKKGKEKKRKEKKKAKNQMSDASVIIPVETTEQLESHEGKPHNGNPITKIEVSPNGKYIITYSREDYSIVGWNVDDIDEGQLKPDTSFKIETNGVEIDNNPDFCISDDKKLVCYYRLLFLMRYKSK
jgi:hypothetical protein